MEGSYSYSVTRYVHDVQTGEFINIGVVVALCHEPFVAARFTTDYRRVKGAFPGLDIEVFLARMKRLQACFDEIDAS
jgi:hypothetical protein